MSKIIVESYNPKWKTEFEKAYTFDKKLLENINIKIEHVGSTAVEGMWAKPILDIDIIVMNTKDSPIAKSSMTLQKNIQMILILMLMEKLLLLLNS